jgi:hypothetical protein
MAMYRDARRLLVAAVLALCPPVAAAQGTAANPSAAASDIRSPSSTNPAAAASDIRNPSATNPAAAASDLRATAVPAQGGAPSVARRQTFAPTIIRKERRPRIAKRAPARKGAVREAAGRTASPAKAVPPTAAQQRAESKAGAIMGSVCRGC